MSSHAHRVPKPAHRAVEPLRKRANQPAATPVPGVTQRLAADAATTAPGGAIAAYATAAAASRARPAPNWTGLPDGLKRGVEALSGVAMDDVRVHRNSSRPAQIEAHAYTQGSEIHLAPGQERHLPHEAWHVVQQMQGRVRPTTAFGGTEINDDEGLEAEAEAMGDRALRAPAPITPAQAPALPQSTRPVAQAFGIYAYPEERPENPPELTPEAEIAGMGGEEWVTLARGISPTQKLVMQDNVGGDSFVSFAKMLPVEGNESNADAAAPAEGNACAYVSQSRDAGPQNLVEFTSDAPIARKYAAEKGRFGYVFYVRIKRKYLSKGSSGAERGWIARQDAPYEIIDSQRNDALRPGWARIGAGDLEKAHRDEQMAEVLRDFYDPSKKAEFLQRLKRGDIPGWDMSVLLAALGEMKRLAGDEREARQ